jgi:IPT/TIG domain
MKSFLTLRAAPLLAAFAVAVLALGVSALSPVVARAECSEFQDCDFTGEKSPPPPVTTRITGIAPSSGWSGDPVTITGTGFSGATVKFDGIPATITSGTSTRLNVVVPPIPITVAGPKTVTVVVTSSKGTAWASYTISPTLSVAGSATFGVNAQFGQGTDGRASAGVSVDRSSGFTNSHLTVTSTQYWSSLTVNMSAVLLDENGVVIGFTTPQTVSSPGTFFAFPSGNTTQSSAFTEALDPGMTNKVRSARVVLTRDAEAELLDTLRNAAAAGQSLYDVLSTLAPYFA